MDLSNLKKAPGSTKKEKRIGRGVGSGKGKTSGRGHKGQKSRSGAKRRYYSEGGQMPLQRRLPKRGFTNIFKKRFQVVKLAALAERKDLKVVDPEILAEMRIVRKADVPIKVLADGELSFPLEVRAHAFSASARKKIEDAGGKAVVI